MINNRQHHKDMIIFTSENNIFIYMYTYFAVFVKVFVD